MQLNVIAKEKCFYGKIRKAGERFTWTVPKTLLDEMSRKGLRTEGALPSYLSLVDSSSVPQPIKEDPLITISNGISEEDVPIVVVGDLQKALNELDVSVDDHWDGRNGKPSTKYLGKVLGRSVSRPEVDEIAPDLTRG